jgi:hypothetical protein
MHFQTLLLSTGTDRQNVDWPLIRLDQFLLNTRACSLPIKSGGDEIVPSIWEDLGGRPFPLSIHQISSPDTSNQRIGFKSCTPIFKMRKFSLASSSTSGRCDGRQNRLVHGPFM